MITHRLARLVFGAAAVLFIAGAVHGQSPQRLEFEVASIRTSIPLDQQIATRQFRVGATITDSRVDLRSVSMLDLIATAYRMKPTQITGPDWIRIERYDVQATYPPGATKEQMPEMMQALLADRFKVRVRRDKRDESVYALVVGKEGHRLTRPPEQPQVPEGTTPPGRTVTIGGQQAHVQRDDKGASIVTPEGAARVTRTETGMLMELDITASQLADTLTSLVNRPVVDLTGLDGRYRIPLEVRQEDMVAMARTVAQRAGVTLPNAPGTDPGTASEPAGSSVFGSVQKLGLALDSRRMPLDILVVEHAERTPTEN